jgi:polar amino acid transport system substrate-binding protein
MKTTLTWLALALTVFCKTSTLYGGTVFKIVYNNKENPPRIMGDSSSINWEKPGITVELLKLVGDKLRMDFKFERMPWKRCLYMIENGSADATFHASYNPDRAEYGVYPKGDDGLDSSRAIYKNAYVFYTLKGSGVTWDGKALKNASRPIGTQLSYAISDDLRKMGYLVEEEASPENNINKLASKRISTYADIESLVDNILSKNQERYAKIVKLHPPIKEKTYYLLISKSFAKKHPQFTEDIWNAIRDVQKTDDYRKIIEKY